MRNRNPKTPDLFKKVGDVSKTKQLQTGEYPKATQQSTALRLLGERTLNCLFDHSAVNCLLDLNAFERRTFGLFLLLLLLLLGAYFTLAAEQFT